MSKRSTKEPRIFNDAIIAIYDLYANKYVSIADISKMSKTSKKDLMLAILHYCNRLSVQHKKSPYIFEAMKKKLIYSLFNTELMVIEDIAKYSDIKVMDVKKALF